MKTLTNQVTLIGNIGVKPTIKETEKGHKIANFSLATHDLKKNREGKFYSNTTWHHIIARGQAAEFLEHYGRKGCKMMVHGTIVDRSFTNKKGEKKRLKMIEASGIKGL